MALKPSQLFALDLAIDTLPGILPKLDAVSILDDLLMGRKHFTPPLQPKDTLFGRLGGPPAPVAILAITSNLYIVSSDSKILKRPASLLGSDLHLAPNSGLLELRDNNWLLYVPGIHLSQMSLNPVDLETLVLSLSYLRLGVSMCL